MKPDINTTVNKLVAYAVDNLLLDPLDISYAVNRLSSLCGVAVPSVDPDADSDGAELDALIAELKTLAPSVDEAAVTEVLFPMPRTINYYLETKLARGTEKALDFLFELYAHGHNIISKSAALGENGYACYYKDDITPVGAAALTVGGKQLVYTPLVIGNRIAALENPDLLTDDVVAREAAFATEYGCAIAARVGDAAEYLTCAATALQYSKVKKQLSDGTVKVGLLDYPVPALVFSGIAKNAVQREVTRILRAAAENSIPAVVAADNSDGLKMYIVFARDVTPDDYITGGGVLAACGVVQTKNCMPLLPVLEKGTALSTDLAEYRKLYDEIGGVKHGKDALKALGGALVGMYLPILKAAASATDEQAESLLTPQ